jgi:hypothetical protein
MVFLWFSYGSHGFPGFSNHHRFPKTRVASVREGAKLVRPLDTKAPVRSMSHFLPRDDAMRDASDAKGEKRLGKPTRKSRKELIVD